MEEDNSPVLSVVIACPAAEGLEEILSAVRDAFSANVETIVASAHDLSPLRESFPWVRFVRARRTALAPHLWAAGIEVAKGQLVATTTSHFLPEADYVSAACRVHTRYSASGIGGRIVAPGGFRPTPWAIYLLRYGSYLGIETAQQVDDFAGDNGVYKRASLAPYLGFIRERGFWEHEIHKMMRSNGTCLVFDPTLGVRQVGAFRFSEFVRQRFQHGWLYGAGLTETSSPMRRVVLALRATMVPALLVARVARRVLAARKHRRAFVLALPTLVCFATAWGLGEGLGSLRLPISR
jgi:hypothetical protein